MKDAKTIRFHIPRTTEDGELELYASDSFEFSPGITVLVGCNGSGKTTLLKRMRYALSKDGAPCLLHEQMRAKDELSARLAFSPTMDDYDAVLGANWKSEGEGHIHRLSSILPTFGKFVAKNPSERPERWLLLDGVESGLSVDVDDDVSDLLDFILDTAPDKVALYVVVATNSFEIAKNRDCVDVTTAEHMTFDDYDSYARRVRDTRQRKDGRRRISEEEWESSFEGDEPSVVG